MTSSLHDQGRGSAASMEAFEALKRREAETFAALLEADEKISAYFQQRIRFPGEAHGLPGPMEARALKDLKQARLLANEAYSEWLQVRERLRQAHTA